MTPAACYRACPVASLQYVCLPLHQTETANVLQRRSVGCWLRQRRAGSRTSFFPRPVLFYWFGLLCSLWASMALKNSSSRAQMFWQPVIWPLLDFVSYFLWHLI